MIHEIETRSETILKAYLQLLIVDVPTVVGQLASDAVYPCVCVVCATVREYIPKTGIYVARMEVSARTKEGKDKDKAIVSSVFGMIREALQNADICSVLTDGAPDCTVHELTLAEADNDLDGRYRVYSQDLDMIWSPTDA